MGRDRLSLQALLAAVTLTAIGTGILRVFPAGASEVTDTIMFSLGVAFFGAAMGMICRQVVLGTLVGIGGAALYLFAT